MTKLLLRKASILLSLVLFFGSTLAAGQVNGVLEAPSYRVGDSWEYEVRGEVASLAGLNESFGRIAVQGLAIVSVQSLGDGTANMEWNAELDLSGALSLGGQNGIGASLQGTVQILRVERYTSPFLLPLETSSQTDFDLQVGVTGLTIQYTASLGVETNQTPGEGFPTYPLEEGSREFTTPTRVETNGSFGLGDNRVDAVTSVELESNLKLDVAQAGEIVVPAGRYQAWNVTITVIDGAGLGPFQELFPVDTQVAFHAADVNGPALIRYFSGGVEVGNVTLRAYVQTTDTPFWQHPAFIVGILAVPVGLFTYLYLRERRRGI